MKKRNLILLFAPLATISIMIPLIMTSCSRNGIVFANYESYMSPDLMDKIKQQQHSIQYVSYSTNEDIKAKFKNSYDIAVPSTYTVLELIKDKTLEKINDWSLFNVSSSPFRWNDSPPSIEPIIKYAKPYTAYDNGKIGSRSDKQNAQCLFSDTTNNIIDSVDDYAHSQGFYSDSETILNYALPYFIQNMTFAYHGNALPELPTPTNHGTDDNPLWYSENSDGTGPITWEDITNTIGSKKYENGHFVNNDDLNSRFKSSNKSKMVMVDDGRSIYDICHLMYNTEENKNNTEINPQDKYEESRVGLEDVYSRFTNKFKTGSFRLNSDSQQVLYSFAAPLNNEPNHYAESDGIISYSGDVLYGTMGGGIDAWKNTWDETNTNVVKPLDTPVMLDMIVMNNKIDKNESKKRNVYNVLKSSVLDGCDKNWQNPDADDNENYDFIGSTDEDGSYRYGTVMNLDYDEYTPPLWNLAKYVSREEDVPTKWNSFYDAVYEDLSDEQRDKKAELLSQIAEINFENGLLELPLSDLIKSDMVSIYSQQKEKL